MKPFHDFRKKIKKKIAVISWKILTFFIICKWESNAKWSEEKKN